jgi:hypothetical protein
MLLRDVVARFETKANVARILGLTPQAVGRWDLDEEVPERYRLRLQYEIYPAIEAAARTAGAEPKRRRR